MRVTDEAQKKGEIDQNKSVGRIPAYASKELGSRDVANAQSLCVYVATVAYSYAPDFELGTEPLPFIEIFSPVLNLKSVNSAMSLNLAINTYLGFFFTRADVRGIFRVYEYNRTRQKLYRLTTRQSRHRRTSIASFHWCVKYPHAVFRKKIRV